MSPRSTVDMKLGLGLTVLSHFLAGSDAITSAALYFDKLPSCLLAFGLLDHAVAFTDDPLDSVLMASFACLCLGALVSRWRSFQKTISYLLLEKYVLPKRVDLEQMKKGWRDYATIITGAMGSLAKVLASSVSVHNQAVKYVKNDAAADTLAVILGVGAFIAIFSVIGVDQNKRKPTVFAERKYHVEQIDGDLEAGRVGGLLEAGKR